MESYSRFDIFLDCLWGLALLLALHLLPFSFFKAEGLKSLFSSPTLIFHTAVLATFAYLFGLRLRRSFIFYQHNRQHNRTGKGPWSVDE